VFSRREEKTPADGQECASQAVSNPPAAFGDGDVHGVKVNSITFGDNRRLRPPSKTTQKVARSDWLQMCLKAERRTRVQCAGRFVTPAAPVQQPWRRTATSTTLFNFLEKPAVEPGIWRDEQPLSDRYGVPISGKRQSNGFNGHSTSFTRSRRLGEQRILDRRKPGSDAPEACLQSHLRSLSSIGRVKADLQVCGPQGEFRT
jgi:hypothetical protein